MREYIKERVVEVANYIVANHSTVRDTAKKYGISKSTVHKDVVYRLQDVNKLLYEEVRDILDMNKAERHIRGGMATKNKYLLNKN
ncbi:MAG: sporulation transcriptional regulator SpoIIID [Clostridiales bacterium GWE2_32_10]|nr:MAG: sporulation transcriptional regulator SpoIIID [Clostridiales bacterium GWE2_32_10]HBY19911.1 sporulation transcriptional regulator SpoIIID [Clostridiales bacterium]